MDERKKLKMDKKLMECQKLRFASTEDKMREDRLRWFGYVQ